MYQGQATYQGQTFPVPARAIGNRLSGVYLSGGQSLPFEARVQGDQMDLGAGGQNSVVVGVRPAQATAPRASREAAHPRR